MSVSQLLIYPAGIAVHLRHCISLLAFDSLSIVLLNESVLGHHSTINLSPLYLKIFLCPCTV